MVFNFWLAGCRRRNVGRNNLVQIYTQINRWLKQMERKNTWLKLKKVDWELGKEIAQWFGALKKVQLDRKEEIDWMKDRNLIDLENVWLFEKCCRRGFQLQRRDNYWWRFWLDKKFLLGPVFFSLSLVTHTMARVAFTDFRLPSGHTHADFDFDNLLQIGTGYFPDPLWWLRSLPKNLLMSLHD